MAGEITQPDVQSFNASKRLVVPVTYGGDTTGTSTAVDATTLTDSGASWGTTQYIGKTVYSLGKSAVIVSHTNTVLTFASWTGGTPATGVYIIGSATIAGPIGTSTVATVSSSGIVMVRAIIPYCSVDLVGASATIALGMTGTAGVFVPLTTATAIDADEFWDTATPTGGYALLPGNSGVAEKDVAISRNIITTIATAAVSAGVVTYYIYWDPISSGATLT